MNESPRGRDPHEPGHEPELGPGPEPELGPGQGPELGPELGTPGAGPSVSREAAPIEPVADQPAGDATVQEPGTEKRRHRTPAARFRRLYGESPWHLLVLLGCLTVCAYAAKRLLERDWFDVAKWIVLGALIPDLVLVPLYAGTDWLVNRALHRGRPVPPTTADQLTGSEAGRDTGTSVLNHLRVPACLSLLLLLVYWPLILQDAEPYGGATGLDPTVFLGRWLLITAAVFAASALLFAVRRRRGPGPTPPPEPTAQDPSAAPKHD
jgi:hypothetical protein